MMVPEPTMQIVGWAATRAANAIIERIADRIAEKAKVRAFAAVRSANRRVRAGGEL